MSYLGSKAASGAYQAIIGLMPPHETYIETHLGSGAIMANKPPARVNIGIDIDVNALEYAYTHRLANYQAELYLHQGCAHEFLKNYSFRGDELVYCDPPYLLETRGSKQRYRHEYSNEDHDELLALLCSLNASIIVSGYPSPRYDQILHNWSTSEFQVMTRGGVRTEKLWYNYQPDSVFWATFAGRDFTHRQQIKRKAIRWAKNYKAMPPSERRAVLAAILQVDAEDHQ